MMANLQMQSTGVLVKNIVIEVNYLQSIIYGPLLGCFLAIRENGFVKDADNFVSLAYARPCWRPAAAKAPELVRLSS